MSNGRILANLDEDLSKYLAGGFTHEQIARRVEGHVEALEGVPYTVVLEARPLVIALEREGCYADEGFDGDPGSAVARMREWAARVREQCS